MAGLLRLGGNGTGSTWRKLFAISALLVSLLVFASILAFDNRDKGSAPAEITVVVASQPVAVPIGTTLGIWLESRACIRSQGCFVT